MMASYRRPSGCKDPGHDSAEVERIIAEVEQTAASADAKACPFCGAAPEIYVQWIYTFSAAAGIRCSKCKIGTGTFPIGKMITGHIYTVADRVNQAARIWNRRQD